MERVMSWLPGSVLSCIPEHEIMENEGLRTQVTNVASMDVLSGDFALMPDAHSGFGMPIGGVAALKDAISPNMVGVDIGCGMISAMTYMEKDEFMAIGRDEIAKRILKRIPVGMGGDRTRSGAFDYNPIDKFIGLDVDFAARQLGTLGSGNHFIELGHDDGFLWVTIHSGSRRLGQVVAKHYHKLAVEFCAAEGISLPHSDLAYLVRGTEEFDNYVRDMWAAVSFANLNREYMLSDVMDILDVDYNDYIQSVHNFAEDDGNVIIHRKGATPARYDDLVVVPMNMGDGIVIGRGLGNAMSMESCSHGAGRTMGRNEAKRTLDFENEEAYMELRDAKVYTKNGSSVLDEMPGAYKDPTEVMARQRDLVEVHRMIRPLACIKG